MPLPDGTTHDYTRRTWGHDYCILAAHDAGQRLDASGWGPMAGLRPRIQRGDYLILVGKGGVGSTRYQVAGIEYRMDPADMWFATLRFAPRDALTKETP
jgi:hypothetical protein